MGARPPQGLESVLIDFGQVLRARDLFDNGCPLLLVNRTRYFGQVLFELVGPLMRREHMPVERKEPGRLMAAA